MWLAQRQVSRALVSFNIQAYTTGMDHRAANQRRISAHSHPTLTEWNWAFWFDHKWEKLNIWTWMMTTIAHFCLMQQSLTQKKTERERESITMNINHQRQHIKPHQRQLCYLGLIRRSKKKTTRNKVSCTWGLRAAWVVQSYESLHLLCCQRPGMYQRVACGKENTICFSLPQRVGFDPRGP